MHEKQGEKLTLVELTNKARHEYGRLARSYVTYLLKETRSHFNFTTIIAQRLGSFDLETLLNSPFTLATRCFSKLFMSFRLRCYFSTTDETQAQEEYLSFVDELRVKFNEFDQPTLLIPDTIDFIMGQTTIHTRSILLRCFKFASLCLDEPFRSLPTVKFGSVKTDDHTSQLVDVVLPVQMYFNTVAGSVEAVTSDSPISEFLELETTFGRSALSDTYDPWLMWTNLDEQTFYPSLIPRVGFSANLGRRGPLLALRFNNLLALSAFLRKPPVLPDCYQTPRLASLQRVCVNVAVKTIDLVYICKLCCSIVFILFGVFVYKS